MDPRLIAGMNEMAEPNWSLKKMYAEMGMQNDILKEALEKNVKAVSKTTDGHASGDRTWRPHCTGLQDVSDQPDLLQILPPVVSDENEEISDWLEHLTANKRV